MPHITRLEVERLRGELAAAKLEVEERCYGCSHQIEQGGLKDQACT